MTEFMQQATRGKTNQISKQVTFAISQRKLVIITNGTIFIFGGVALWILFSVLNSELLSFAHTQFLDLTSFVNFTLLSFPWTHKLAYKIWSIKTAAHQQHILKTNTSWQQQQLSILHLSDCWWIAKVSHLVANPWLLPNVDFLTKNWH